MIHTHCARGDLAATKRMIKAGGAQFHSAEQVELFDAQGNKRRVFRVAYLMDTAR